MPLIAPFQGIRFDSRKVKDLSSLIAPPYDVISPAEQATLYSRSPYNIIRLELGRPLPGDNESSNKYTRARALFQLWLDEGVLRREEKPAMYVFEHSFKYRGQMKTRWDLSALLKLEEWDTRRVRPHEAILSQPVSDRLNLLRACRVNISPVLGLFRYRKDGLLSILPDQGRYDPNMSATDDYGVAHRMWTVTDRTVIDDLCDMYRDRVLYIADGHHRYQTALDYCHEQQAAGKGEEAVKASSYVMATIMDAGDPGLLTLPTHRLVRGLPPAVLQGLVERLEKDFLVSKVDGREETGGVDRWLDYLRKHGTSNNAFGVFGLSGPDLLALQPRDGEAIRQTMPAEHCPAWKKLDVSLLQWAVLRGLLGIEDPDRQRDMLDYVKDADEAVRLVGAGQYQLAFLLNPVPVNSIMAVADDGDRMPQKSSYFYPKPPTGMVMHSLF